MKLAGSITSKRNRNAVTILACLIFITGVISAQRVAILTPAATSRDSVYAEALMRNMFAPARVLDRSQSEAAFRSTTVSDPFNMTTAEATVAAAVMGCDFFIVLRTGGQRRSSFSKPDYFEAFAAHYVVDGRTGELRGWILKSLEASTQEEADKALIASITGIAKELGGKMTSENGNVLAFEQVPDPDSPAALKLKPPIPYRRIKPEYTNLAFLYDVRATIDMEADVNSDGKILTTRIVRWAGFGLEQSVEKAVRSMNWRPAMRDGKPLPMRVLLRYNFTKVDKE